MDLKTDIETLTGALGGKLLKGDPRAVFDRFETDSRKVKKGDFFLPLKGLNYDAHTFLPATLAAGAGGWIAEAAKLPAQKPATVIAVDNTLLALQRLAAWHRQRFNIPLTAITGSNGKSTTKEMLLSIFRQAGKTCSNAGNCNNQFGLPLSLLELDQSHKFGVFELGASRKGDILEIGTLARPTCGIITNIGPSHLEYFGSMETVFETKIELAACLAAGGKLVYNSDDAYLSRLEKSKVNGLTFGCGKEADVRVSPGKTLELTHEGKSFRITLPAPASHNFYNAAAAAGAALACGLSWDMIKAGLETYTPPPMRMQVLHFKAATIILDAYNANPQSMAAALKELADYPAPRWLMLGDMKELGAHSAAYHAELGKALTAAAAEKIFLAGPEMKAAANAFYAAGGKGLIYAPEMAAWLAEARELIAGKSGTFLIKASRSMKFEKIIEGMERGS
ncbi:MAG: UDP-N-acetylmuramoyl-tripeptide--D-alanyl-D-alanine ligase [Elusimicrobia bacterium]|nr:UDP-N-acetylmuramoyl-tripeptide--D-alanyl-D-alanine ligase [Elusimicrobiota bacterium]